MKTIAKLCLVSFVVLMLAVRPQAHLSLCDPYNTNIVYVINGTNCFITTNFNYIFEVLPEIEFPNDVEVTDTNIVAYPPIRVLPDPPEIPGLQLPTPLDNPLDFTNGLPDEIWFDRYVITDDPVENFQWLIGFQYDDEVEAWRAMVIGSNYIWE